MKSQLLRVLKCPRGLLQPKFITTFPAVVLPDEFDKKISENPDDLKAFKTHPGKSNGRNVKLPDVVEENINRLVGDYELNALAAERDTFKVYIEKRRKPLESKEKLAIKKKLVEDEVLSRGDDDEYLMKRVMDSFAESKNRRAFKDPLFPNNKEDEELFMRKVVARNRFSWVRHHLFTAIETQSCTKCLAFKVSVDYNMRMGLLYLISRFDANYATLIKIFDEIKRKDLEFKPECLFDFGSGCGSSMWAAQTTWPSSLSEFLNIDKSVHMNSIAHLLTRRKASIAQPSLFKRAIFKQNFPSSFRQEYDLVTCAFTLIEHANLRERLETIERLWEKLAHNGYMVLVEYGTKDGFQIISEARDFILKHLCRMKAIDENDQPLILHAGHVFAPCPHNRICPMLEEGQSCTFNASYTPLYLSGVSNKHQEIQRTPYSYVVIKKTPEKSTDKWARFVYREPSKFDSWLCTPEGTLGHLKSTKARNKTIWRIAKYSSLGDEFPAEWKKTKSKFQDSDDSS